MASIVQIGDRRWLAGMSWSSFEDPPSKAALKEDALRFNAGWVCVRKNKTVTQAGFSATIDNVKRPTKLYSLAAMLADSCEQPWVGIFKIEEGVWWYIAVRDRQAILPDGDVIGDEDDIQAAKKRHSIYNDWKFIEGDITQLDALINGIDAKPSPVRSLLSVISPAIILISVAVILSLLGGYNYWERYQKQQAEELARAKARALLAPARPAAVAALSPLLSTPQPNDWLAACGNVILALPLSQDGWALDQVLCVTDSVSVHWVRKEGATVTNKPEGILSPQGDDVDQVIPLVGLKTPSEDNSINLLSAISVLRAWAQAADFALSMNNIAPARLPGATNVPAMSPSQMSVQMDISISPFGINLSAIPGLRLTNLKSTDKGWIAQGVLYGK